MVITIVVNRFFISLFKFVGTKIQLISKLPNFFFGGGSSGIWGVVEMTESSY
jgi:hypothetical protein